MVPLDNEAQFSQGFFDSSIEFILELSFGNVSFLETKSLFKVRSSSRSLKEFVSYLEKKSFL